MNTLFRTVGMASVLAFSVLAQVAPVKQLSKSQVGPEAAPVGVSRSANPKTSNPRATSATGGNSWFPVTVRELGTFYGQGEAVGLFEFTNPHNEPIEWRSMTASCQCASAEVRVGELVYRVISKPERKIVRVTKEAGKPETLETVKSITIGPNEAGVVETRLDMHNITGGKSASLDIHTTDPVEAQTKLTFRATGAELFSISPKEINLNKMTWSETREFSVTVSASAAQDWEILGMDDAGEHFDVKWEKVQQGDLTSYRINGKYGPVSGETAGGGVLKFRTNLAGAATFSVRVLAFVQGPLEVKPGGFLTLGLIRKGKSVSKTVVFEPNDGFDLQAEALEFEKMTLHKDFISATQRKEGNNLIVELSVADNAPTGLVKGELVVKLNHPLIKEKRIVFNGFVR